MKTCAYDELYMPLAQRVLGDMFDFGVNTLKYDIETLFNMFIVSGIAHQVEAGNPMYIAGMNGCEVAKEVVAACGLDRYDVEDIMYIDKSPEYWIGWSLAYYQWISNLRFADINKIVTVKEMYSLYFAYHEMDIEAFVEMMDEKAESYRNTSRLSRIRKYASLSQSMLAAKANVPIRQIQLFEQGKRDINKTQGETLMKLAKALGCEIEDLLQK